MRILVLGETGPIGSYIILELIAAGHWSGPVGQGCGSSFSARRHGAPRDSALTALARRLFAISHEAGRWT